MFITYPEDYSCSSEADFRVNVWHARRGAQRAVNYARYLGYSASKATVIAHSMGGILARLHAAGRNGDYYRADNLGQGDFYKLITLYTPHRGSAGACVLDGIGSFWPTYVLSPPVCFDCGAVRDLRPDSQEIQTLPAVTVPSHTIAGLGGSQAVSAMPLGVAVGAFRDRLGTVVFRMVSLINNLPSILGSSQNDLIVTQDSALGGLTGAATTSVPFQLHTGNDWFIGIHTGAGEQEYIGSQILEPLIRASVHSSQFAPSLPGNSNVSVPLVCVNPPVPPQPATNGGVTLTIDPTTQVVAPGGTVRMTVNRTGSFAPPSIYIGSTLGVARVDATPATINLPVAMNAYGTYNVHAVGVDTNNRVAFSSVVPFEVTTAAQLVALEVATQWVGLGCVGDTFTLEVIGRFNDGSSRSLNAAEVGTTYTSSSSAVVGLSGAGTLMALGNGQATVRVANGAYSATVAVEVSPSLCIPPLCYANCDASTTPPVANVGDFTCFLQQYSAAILLPGTQQVSHYANCDGSTLSPVINVADFTCFLQKYAAGCP
jgi:hypothetical protein